MASAICTSEGATGKCNSHLERCKSKCNCTRNRSAICTWNSANRFANCTSIFTIKVLIEMGRGAICTWTIGVEVQIDPPEKSNHHNPSKPANLTPSKWSPQNTSIRGTQAPQKPEKIKTPQQKSRRAQNSPQGVLFPREGFRLS